MKRFLVAATLAVAACAAQAQVSISIGQPGFYGRLDIGGFPAPALLFPEPVMIRPVPPGRPPLYLRVPPGHAKNWKKYCGRYSACGEPVYFVRDEWYEREYMPRYQERHYGGGPRYDRDDRRGPPVDRRGPPDRRDDDYDRGPDRGDRGHGHGPRH